VANKYLKYNSIQEHQENRSIDQEPTDTRPEKQAVNQIPIKNS
jgi:hypothetical protein